MCLHQKMKSTLDHLKKVLVFLTMFCIFFSFIRLLSRPLSSFALISPPPDKFHRRPPFNTQGARLTYGTFYWLCCFLLCSSIPYALSSPPILCSGVASSLNDHNTVRKLASHFVDESFWLNSSLLNPDCEFQGQLLVRFLLF